MGIITLSVTGPRGEELAMECGLVTEIAVGVDSELGTATFDSNSLEGGELEAVIVDALGGIDPDWRTHLEIAE
jgi:hypothetical protein